MLDKGQKQTTGHDSVALQAGQNIIFNSGVSASEARSIAIDVAKSTFYELTGDAKILLFSRVEEITDLIINKIKNEQPELLNRASDPDFQYALLSVQRQYGRTGDKDLGSLLANLLVDREKESPRELRQIVLTESLDTTPKLTDRNISLLSLCFVSRYVTFPSIKSNEALGSLLDTHFKIFSDALSSNHNDLAHLQFTGCVNSTSNHLSLETFLRNNYSGLLNKGVLPNDHLVKSISPSSAHLFITQCLNDQSKVQVKADNTYDLHSLFSRFSTPESDKNILKSLFDSNQMSTDEVREKLTNLRPYMDVFFKNWHRSGLDSMELTSVGLAIAHANVQRKAGRIGQLSTWIS